MSIWGEREVLERKKKTTVNKNFQSSFSLKSSSAGGLWHALLSVWLYLSGCRTEEFFLPRTKKDKGQSPTKYFPHLITSGLECKDKKTCTSFSIIVFFCQRKFLHEKNPDLQNKIQTIQV